MAGETAVLDGTAGAASTGGTGAGSGSTSPHHASDGTGSNTGANGTASAAAGAGTGSTGSGTGAQGATGGAAQVDRSNWHPPHVNSRLSRENQQFKAELQRLQNQVRALVGEKPSGSAQRLPQGVTQEMLEQAREELALVRPDLAKLTPELVDKLLNFLTNEHAQVVDSGSQMWKQHGANTARAIQSEVSKQLGTISQRGMQKIYAAFHAQLSSDDAFYERYVAGDPGLVVDFVTEYKADIGDAHASFRTASATGAVASARTLPRGGSSSSVIPAGGGEAQLDPNDEDALHKRAFQRMQAANAARA